MVHLALSQAQIIQIRMTPTESASGKLQQILTLTYNSQLTFSMLNIIQIVSDTIVELLIFCINSICIPIFYSTSQQLHIIQMYMFDCKVSFIHQYLSMNTSVRKFLLSSIWLPYS